MNQFLDLDMMTNNKLLESTGQALNYQNLTNTVPNPSPQIPILHTNREPKVTTYWVTIGIK
jgi:hypothetical protein